MKHPTAQKRRFKKEVLPPSSREEDQTGVAVLGDAVPTGRTVRIKNHQPCSQTNAALRQMFVFCVPLTQVLHDQHGDTVRRFCESALVRGTTWLPRQVEERLLLTVTSCILCLAGHERTWLCSRRRHVSTGDATARDRCVRDNNH